MKGKRHWTWLSMGIAGAVIAFVTWLVISKWDDIVSFPWKLNLGYLVIALVAHSIALGFTYIAWHLMIRRLGNFKDWYADLRFYYIATLAKRIPTSVPSIGSRLFMYGQVGVPGAAVLNCVLLETLLLGLGGIVVFVIFVPFYGEQIGLAWVILSLVLLMGCLLVLLLRPDSLVRLTNYALRRFGRTELTAHPSAKDIVLWIGVYIMPWLFAGVSLSYALKGMSDQIDVGLGDAIVISTVATLIALLNLLLPGGFALKEMTMTALLLPWMPASAALVVAFAYRLLHTANEMLWALAVTALPARNAPESSDPSTAGQIAP